jgi:RNA ligase (TIGR02306 family)
MRTLCSVQRIHNIAPIPNADRIELCEVLGWRAITQKGAFSVGDLAIYCEVDSLLPKNYVSPDGTKPFDFLLQKGVTRIRTMSLKNTISQGLLLPLSVLQNPNVSEGDDVTEILGVEKYEPPIPACLSGQMKGAFPSFIPKTDETRVQVLQEVLDRYVGTKCYASVKLDGTSSTHYFYNGEFGVCGRNIDYLDTEGNTYWKVSRQQHVEDILRDAKMNLAIQGEICGEGIQGNKYKIKGQKLFTFNIFDIDNYRYFSYSEFRDFCTYYNLLTVPILDDNYILENDISKLIEMSKGDSVIDKGPREGIVIRPLVEIRDSNIGRVSFKAINPEFLLKYEDS